MIKLIPDYYPKIWGSVRMAQKLGLQDQYANIGEIWLVSALAGKTNLLESQDITFKQYVKANHVRLGLKPDQPFPLLLKIIAAEADLSIQVHPNDKQAQKMEGHPYGKAECWLVLDTEPGASIIAGSHYIKEKRKDTIMIKDRNLKVQAHPVRAGDFISLESGTVHALGRGLTVFELQQSADITYRIFDYERLQDGKPRTLHIEQAAAVIKTTRPALKHIGFDSPAQFIKSRHFMVCALTRPRTLPRRCFAHYPFCLLTVISGEGEIGGYSMRPYDTLLIYREERGRVVIPSAMKVIISAAR